MTMSLDAERAPQFLHSMLRTNTVVLISATYCTFCARVKTMLIELGQAFVSLEIDVLPNGRTLFSVVQTRTGINTVPQVFVRGKFLGGYDTVLDLHHQEQLAVVCGTEKTSASASQPPPTPPPPTQPHLLARNEGVARDAVVVSAALQQLQELAHLVPDGSIAGHGWARVQGAAAEG